MQQRGARVSAPWTEPVTRSPANLVNASARKPREPISWLLRPKLESEKLSPRRNFRRCSALQQLPSTLRLIHRLVTVARDVSGARKRARVSSMKPIPLLLLMTSVFLSAHIPLSACRPREHPLEVLQMNRVGGEPMSFLVAEKLLQYLQRRALDAGITNFPSTQMHTPLQEDSSEELMEFTKRNDDPPISIDLTFHLLRNMIEMARIENQREQAGLNRKFLDEVGK
ncbi:hypothetical protein DNTS_008941 [Danionella cerebrum]|uniref:Corticotropin-releasing factor domain-containing protein n=1 Tax=Danionella cerebrum TaxID=2873325 RepID=A0A553RL86_9TELE|nr:hypothetical protein DNTS_008941 [Danionella translucida]